MSWLHQQNLSFNCTTKSDDVTASFKFKSLNYFLSRGDFMPSNERVQTDERQISKQTVRRRQTISE